MNPRDRLYFLKCALNSNFNACPDELGLFNSENDLDGDFSMLGNHFDDFDDVKRL